MVVQNVVIIQLMRLVLQIQECAIGMVAVRMWSIKLNYLDAHNIQVQQHVHYNLHSVHGTH